MSTQHHGIPHTITGIDTHAHVFHRGLALSHERRYAPAYDATIADYLAMLDQNAMSHGVLIQPSFLGTDNDYLLAALRAAPTRLRGIAVVAPEIEPQSLADLDAAGCVGVRLNLIGQPDPPFATPLWQRHLADLAALVWQIELQAEARRLPSLLPPLLATGLPVIVDHFGRPDSVDDDGFRALLRADRVIVKLSGAYRLGAPTLATAALAMLRDALGPDRLLWGSDWPHTQFEDRVSAEAVRAELDRWLPDPLQRQAVLVDTPARLFRFRTAPSYKLRQACTDERTRP